MAMANDLRHLSRGAFFISEKIGGDLIAIGGDLVAKKRTLFVAINIKRPIYAGSSKKEVLNL